MCIGWEWVELSSTHIYTAGKRGPDYSFHTHIWEAKLASDSSGIHRTFTVRIHQSYWPGSPASSHIIAVDECCWMFKQLGAYYSCTCTVSCNDASQYMEQYCPMHISLLYPLVQSRHQVASVIIHVLLARMLLTRDACSKTSIASMVVW